MTSPNAVWAALLLTIVLLPAQTTRKPAAPHPTTPTPGTTSAPESTAATIGRLEDEMRLACQVQVNGDCTVETRPAFNWSGENFWQKPYPNK